MTDLAIDRTMPPQSEHSHSLDNEKVDEELEFSSIEFLYLAPG
jgi:hypothetical protein